MQAFALSALTVFVGEIGDKTQLLALALACRYRRRLPLAAGILAATLANHTLAAWFGVELHSVLNAASLRWVVGLSFLATAAWALRADDPPADAATARSSQGVFWIALISFFLAEIGDKTQIATALLAARFDALASVVAGTTLGMLLADLPVVWFGSRVAGLRLGWLRGIAALLLAALGVVTLLG
ncbi:MAG: TMEM165/GDT1 family protein [Gammaproteobacteria bacterium]|nr:TMEM165/GDT1 family protein [Gammaproteobacteria bacterium]